MFTEQIYSTRWPFMCQLTEPAGFWQHTSVNTSRRYGRAYSEGGTA